MKKYEYDVVYIKGNQSSGLAIQHKKINNSILSLLGSYTYTTIDSNMTNKNFNIPSAKVYIGFSRGSRYLKKLDKKSLKLSIGGISGSGINTFINIDDKILEGDISVDSMNAHFIILEVDKIKIKKLIDDFLIINIK
jgi:hypothetical protein